MVIFVLSVRTVFISKTLDNLGYLKRITAFVLIMVLALRQVTSAVKIKAPQTVLHRSYKQLTLIWLGQFNYECT